MPLSPFGRLLLLMPLGAVLASCASMPSVRRMSDEECMTRVMYFESNRSSPEGMLAVGTVVMNRKASGKYPTTVCGVVGQRNQFAPGVLSKPMAKGRDLANKMAKQVLRGAKHERVGRAMFFHTAGYSYPYTNMHYVAIAGGNAFYEKRRNATSSQADIRRLQEARPASRRPAENRGFFDFFGSDLAPRPTPVIVRRAAQPRPVYVAPADDEQVSAEPVYREPVYRAPQAVEPAEPRYQLRLPEAAPAAAPQVRVRAEPQRLEQMSIEDLITRG